MRASRAAQVVTMSVGLAVMAVGQSVIPAFAADVIRVNSTGNQADAAPGDLVCDTVAGGTPQCTLRAAIETANADGDADTIVFGFGGTSVKTINVPGALPAIVQPVTIDGYSAANTAPNTRAAGSNARLRILLKGPRTGAVDGLRSWPPRPSGASSCSASGTASTWVRAARAALSPATSSARRRTARTPCPTAGTGCTSTAIQRWLSARPAGPPGNLIVGNRGAGILLCEDVQGTSVRGNLIGVGADGRKDRQPRSRHPRLRYARRAHRRRRQGCAERHRL